MDSKDSGLHFLLVPLMSQSHLIPFTDMAKLFARRGLTVTIVMTPLNAARYQKVLDFAESSNLKIQFLTFPFPCKEVGLPEGCENLELLPSPDLSSDFLAASNMLQEPLEKWLEMILDAKPTCLVSDVCFPWTAGVSVKFNIPRVVFKGVSCFTLLCSYTVHNSNILESVTSDFEPFLVPDVPDRIVLTKVQLPHGRVQRKLDTLRDEAERTEEGILVNTCEELESGYVKRYQELGKRIWCIGPISLADTSNKTEEEHEYLKWLDSKSPNSVLYVCFGSLCKLPAKQLMELGLALQASKASFIWVVRKGDISLELEKWLVEEKFEEKIQGRGVLIRGWAPQVQILSHPAVGGFLTHCGWNSTLEGIFSGLPMITWPMFAEQFLNERLIVDVLKIGVSIGVVLPMRQWGQEGKSVGEFVEMEKIKKAIETLMDEGEDGEERRRRAKDFGDKAKRANEEGGSSYANLTRMIQYVTSQI